MISFTLRAKTKKGHCFNLTSHHGSLCLFFFPTSTPLGLPMREVPLRKQIFKSLKIKNTHTHTYTQKRAALAVGWWCLPLCETLWFAFSVIRPACWPLSRAQTSDTARLPNLWFCGCLWGPKKSSHNPNYKFNCSPFPQPFFIGAGWSCDLSDVNFFFFKLSEQCPSFPPPALP
jgi:hypothetical protein